jgi:hypothetical protein
MSESCNCTKQEVCDPCDRTAVKTITDISEYAKWFITERFPEGLGNEMQMIITEIVVDAFHDGARWSEQTRMDEAIISLAPKRATELIIKTV